MRNKGNWAAILAATVLAIAAGAYLLRPRAPAPATNEYADSKQCAACHAEIARTYRLTGMARSFYRPTPRNTNPTNSQFHHLASDTYYSMLTRDGRYYQRRWRLGFDGKETDVEELPADYIMGSGARVRTYLHRTARGTLIELPLAWYPDKGGYWSMNPGYDTGHTVPHRAITYDCMFCHNAYPSVPPNAAEPGRDPIYLDPLPEGIDCQRCHGPGARHIRTPQRQNIVNPARMPADQQMEICMQCHLEPSSFPLPSIVKTFGRGPFSYRAGEPLGGFMLFFDHAPSSGHQDKFEIVSSAYRLRQSQCYLRSNGKLTCLTCHDPHNIPRGREAAGHYNAVCRQCHAAVSSAKHPAAPDCVGCHMPKRRTEDVVRAVMTDHLIQRRKPARDLLAEIPERHETDATAYHGEVVPYYPAPPLYIALAQVKNKSNLQKGVEQLSAEIEKQHPPDPDFYLELGDAWRNAGRLDKAASAYEEAVRRNAASPFALRRLGVALRESGQLPRAQEILTRATQAAPDDAKAWYELGLLARDQNRTADSIAAFEKAVALDPDLPEAYNSLGGALAETGRPDEAESAFRSALRLHPDSADAQANLATLLASKGDLPQAIYRFEHALRLRPDDAPARFNYAIALARVNRFDDAQRQLESAIRIDPRRPEAHDVLGSLLAQKGNLNAAERELREALRLQPDLSRAHLNLGNVLAEKHDLAAAAEHLRQAANSPDPAIRQQAQQALGSVQK